MKWLRRFSGRRRRTLRMTPAHDGGAQPFLDDGAGACLDDGLFAQQCGAMRDLVEIGLDLIGLVGAEQAGIAMRVGEPQTVATRDDVLNRNAPLFGQTLDSLTGHPVLLYSSLI